MSNESSAAIRDARKDWVTEHREMYLSGLRLAAGEH